jgi:phage terminase small subunit
MDFAELELGPKMQVCNERERLFVWHYVTGEDGDATAAARLAGYTDNDTGAIRVRAHALMHRDRVLAAIEEVAGKAFRGLLAPAVRATRKIINDPKDFNHAKVVLSTLSRLGKSERTGVDVNVAGEVQVNHTDQALVDLRTLMGLGVAREKLVEIFGFSGLSRYEKMLAEQDARAPKVIEGTVNR